MVHLDCNNDRPACTHPTLLERESELLSWRKKFLNYTDIKVYVLEASHSFDNEKHAERLKFAKDIIASVIVQSVLKNESSSESLHSDDEINDDKEEEKDDEMSQQGQKGRKKATKSSCSWTHHKLKKRS